MIMVINIHSDDELPSEETLEMHDMIILVRSVFNGKSQNYSQIFFWMNVCISS